MTPEKRRDYKNILKKRLTKPLMLLYKETHQRRQPAPERENHELHNDNNNLCSLARLVALQPPSLVVVFMDSQPH